LKDALGIASMNRDNLPAAGHSDALGRANGREHKQRYKYSEKNLIHDRWGLLPANFFVY
jgi:hypothetical protein